MEEVKNHPLMFTFRDAISGEGFLASVTLCGRAVMIADEGKQWIYGVEPGGIAESGDTPHEAFLCFRNRYKEILLDMVEECETFSGFKREVERFSVECDTEDKARWESSLEAIRAGHLKVPHPFSDLPKKSPETNPTQVTVEHLDTRNTSFQPSDNMTDLYSMPAAA